MKFRHPTFFSEVVSTSFGQLELDKDGFVTNQEELAITDAQMATLPDFIDNDDFSIEQFPTAPEVLEGGEVPEPTLPDPGELTPVETIVRELLLDPEKRGLNTRGSLDLPSLNRKLNEAGHPGVTGSERDILQRRVRSSIATPEPAYTPLPEEVIATAPTDEEVPSGEAVPPK